MLDSEYDKLRQTLIEQQQLLADEMKKFEK
jgi:hypothetical protein